MDNNAESNAESNASEQQTESVAAPSKYFWQSKIFWSSVVLFVIGLEPYIPALNEVIPDGALKRVIMLVLPLVILMARAYTNNPALVVKRE